MNEHDCTCENCGHGSLESFIDRPGHQLKRCPVCNLFQKGILESNSVYEGDYHSGYSSRRRSKERTAAIRLGSTTKYLTTDRPRLLDIGCSVGATVKAAADLGWEASGVDVSQGAVEFCKQEGLDCHQITGTALLTNWHVIEHVQDVRETLAEWRRVLKPDGVMILETPDSTCAKVRRLGTEYKKFWPPEHLYTFDRANLSSILESSGFELLPTRLIGKATALPLHLTAYAIGYRGLKEAYRSLGVSKSLEITCRAA